MKRVRRLFSGMLILFIALSFPAAGYAASHSLTTLYNNFYGDIGFMFDVTVLSSGSVEIDSFDASMTGYTTDASVYYREGGRQGYENDSTAWTLAGSATVTPQGINQPTHLAVGGITMDAGKTYGIYITFNDAYSISYNLWYGPGSTAYQDANLKISAGTPVMWGTFNVINPNAVYVWNGTINYSTPDPVVKNPQTGDPTGPYLWVYMVSASAAFGALWVLIRKYRRVRIKP